jgi:hemerythrin-like domain-containing protein
LAEHEAGRKLVAAMSRALADHQAGQTGAAASLREAAGEYVKLLTDHISKEDHVLYPVADEKIAAPVQAAMVEAFEKIEEERIGVGTHERYHEMLKEFRRGYLSTK